MSESIKGWTIRSLSELAQYHNGLAFKPSDWVEEGTKIIRIEQLNQPTGDYDFYAGRVSEVNRIKDGDLIFSWSATLKVVIWKHGDGVLNQHLFKVVPYADVDKHLLFHLLDFNMDSLSSGSHGSTMKHIKRGELTTYKVAMPPPPEQRKIARILTTLDNLIEKTEAVIAKYQAIKQGMMHDLFTRGVDAHGHLRPTQAEAPDLYKQSELGWIPKEWEAHNLGDVANLQVGYAFKSSWFRDDGAVRLLRGENVGSGRPDWSDTKYLSSRMVEQFQEFTLYPRDVVIGMDHTFTKSGVKITHLQQEDCPSLLVQRVGRFVPKECEATFLRAFLGFERYHADLARQQKGMDIPHLSQTEILEPLIPLPKPDEQVRIAERLTGLVETISSERQCLFKMNVSVR